MDFLGVKNCLVTGLPMANQLESVFSFVFFLFFFSVSVKVLPVTPLLSSGFVHRVLSVYFVRLEGAGGIRRFPWCTQMNV